VEGKWMTLDDARQFTRYVSRAVRTSDYLHQSATFLSVFGFYEAYLREVGSKNRRKLLCNMKDYYDRLSSGSSEFLDSELRLGMRHYERRTASRVVS